MRRARSAIPIVLLAVILIAIACNAEGIFTGVSFGAMWWPSFDEDLVTYNLYRLLDVGCNSIILIVDWYVDTYTDPTIEPWYRDRPGFPDTNWFYPTLYDHEVRYVIETAHSLGLTVMLKLHVETLDWMETGIGRFGLHPRSERWDELFESYLAYADHYAEMCEELGVEILCLGCEMESMTHAATDGLSDPDRRWRELIADVRETYSGELTYSCAVMGSWTRPFSSPGKVTFWDALDYIGVELYRGLSNTLEPTLEQLKEGVRDTFVRFVEPLVRQYDRPVLLPELNFMHCDGTNMSPYSPDNPPTTTCDYQEHADCYEAVLSVVEEISQTNEYLKGIYWWSGMLVYPWEDLTPDFGEPCAGTDLWGTLAESVVRAHWQGTNGWTIPTASAADLSFDILPQEAATDGCQVTARVNEGLGKGIVEVTPAEGWEFE
ncbi:hypothetical protein IH601_04465, partial [Candidatus Bipolaricaulota bacterium]|nr:hypothetical protein [Candidatus Bipolaricaulota bacterium]